MADALGIRLDDGDAWFPMGDLGRRLRDALSPDYAVVTEPRVYGEDLDALIVGPQGVYVLATMDWAGRVRTSRSGHWEVTDSDGHTTSYPNPAPRAQKGVRAVRRWMADEFPRLKLPIRALLVLVSPRAEIETYGATDPPAVVLDNLGQEIAAMRRPSSAVSLERERVQELARAFQERELTSRQKATQPFVFRSGGVFGSGRKVWTIRAAVKHMDRRPDDGAYHLRNGTLERWLRDQGARHLATLAREVTNVRESDARVAVEEFLIGTGLVRRPKLRWYPRRVDLGYVLPGEDSVARCRVRKGLGRGYLFGRVHTQEPWLRVDPQRFSGSAELMVWASSETLSIQRKAHVSPLYLDTSATEEPVEVPARLRVVSMPHRINRWVVRPLVGFLLGAIFGSALGVLLAQYGMGVPRLLRRLGYARADLPQTVFGVAVGASWGVLGAWRGFRQRPGWPIGYATLRWLLRLGIWTIALGVIAAAGLGALVWVAAVPISLISNTGLLLGLAALAFANIPSTVSEVHASMEEASTDLEAVDRRAMRPLVSALIGVGIIVVLGAAGFALEPVYREVQARDVAGTVRTWVSQRATAFGEWIDASLDRLYLDRYDRRAPTHVPTEAPTTASSSPTSE